MPTTRRRRQTPRRRATARRSRPTARRKGSADGRTMLTASSPRQSQLPKATHRWTWNRLHWVLRRPLRRLSLLGFLRFPLLRWSVMPGQEVPGKRGRRTDGNWMQIPTKITGKTILFRTGTTNVKSLGRRRAEVARNNGKDIGSRFAAWSNVGSY